MDCQKTKQNKTAIVAAELSKAAILLDGISYIVIKWICFVGYDLDILLLELLKLAILYFVQNYKLHF